MKKNLAFCIVFALLISVLSAAADSVWMPMDDFFAGTWDPESDAYCGHESSPLYIAAGPEGYVRAVYTPVDQQIVGTYPNGTEFQINFICGVGGDRWGTVYAVRLPGETVFTLDWILPVRKEQRYTHVRTALLLLHITAILPVTLQ